MKRRNIIFHTYLTMWFGFTGMHRLFKKQYLTAVIYFLTFGLFGIGWLYDIIKVIRWAFKEWPIYEKPKKERKETKKSIPKPTSNTDAQKLENRSFRYLNNEINLEYEKCYELPADFVVLDFETSGFSHENDKIIEIGATKYKNFEMIDKFETLVNPKKKISQKIQTITKLTNGMLAKAPTIDFALPKLLDFIGDEITIAHNAPFDMKFLLQNIGKLNITYKNYKVIDTLRMSRRLIDIENHKLETLKGYLKLDEFKSHSAIDDCHITGELYKHCYKLINKQFDQEKLIYFNNIKQILIKNNLDISLLKFSETKDRYYFIRYYYPIFEFKIGKKIYGLTKKTKEEVLQIWNEAHLEEATKSEYGNTRIILNSSDDVFKIADIIIEKYHQVIKRMEDENLLFGNREFLKGYYY